MYKHRDAITTKNQPKNVQITLVALATAKITTEKFPAFFNIIKA